MERRRESLKSIQINPKHKFSYLAVSFCSIIVVLFLIVPAVYPRSQEATYKAVVTINNAALRLYPALNSQVISELPLGISLDVLEASGEWLKVRLPPRSDGTIIVGYIHKTMVEIQKEGIPSVPREKNRALFQVEIFGGYSPVSPFDLNLRARFDVAYNDFYSDGWYDWQKLRGDISSWDKGVTGTIDEITRILPYGLRLRFQATDRFSISLGLISFSKTQTSTMKTIYEAVWAGTWNTTQETAFSPYTLYVKGILPMVGIHYCTRSHPVSFEGSVAAGPLFSKCGFNFDQETEYIGDWGFSSSWGSKIQNDGTGTGVAVDGALRVNLEFSDMAGFFVEGGYSYKNVNRVKGSGSSESDYQNSDGEYDYQDEEWEGEWGIKEITRTYDWGSRKYQYPSCSWKTAPQPELPIRAFVLNLSGFQIRLGLFFKF